jgi:hypothetical protein
MWMMERPENWYELDFEKSVESSLQNENLPQGRHLEVAQLRLGCWEI